MAVNLIDEAILNGARQYKACAVLELQQRTYKRWKQSKDMQDRRQCAATERLCAHALSEEEKKEIIAVCNQKQFESLPPSQIVPILADQGIYLASESSFYRVLRQVGQNNKRGGQNNNTKPVKPEPAKATASNQVWSWDITFLASEIKGVFYKLYMVEDIFDRSIVGWEVHEEELSEHAATLIEKTCERHKVEPGQLLLHADNGSAMRGFTMLAKLQNLGVMPSFSRPSVSNDNPYSESLFKTLKYCPKYPRKPFKSLDHARQWVFQFVTWYNTQHRHSSIRFVTPEQRRRGQDKTMLVVRDAVYKKAKTRHPQRWKGRATRNWSYVNAVWLNPNKQEQFATQVCQAA